MKKVKTVKFENLKNDIACKQILVLLARKGVRKLESGKFHILQFFANFFSQPVFYSLFNIEATQNKILI